jgi:hypothetical protein
MFLMTSPVGELVNWDDLKKSIATGDILLCQTVGLFGAIEQLATAAPYTHVAVFIRGKNGDLVILESSRTDRDSGYKDMVTGKTDGPKVIDADFYIHNYIENDMGVLTYRPLRTMWLNEPIKITDERAERLNNLFDVVLKKNVPYERNPFDLANSLLHVYGMDHTDPTSMFCSETVSTVLVILDVPLVNVPDKTIPCDFAQEFENIIDKDKNARKGMNAVEFGNEITIVIIKGNGRVSKNPSGPGKNDGTPNLKTEAQFKMTTDFPFSKIPIGPRMKQRRPGRHLRFDPLGSDTTTTNDERHDERHDALVGILQTTSYRLPPWVERRLIDEGRYVDPYTRRSKDIEEFKRILQSYSRPWVDDGEGPVDVNQIIITYKIEETGEIRKTDTLLSLAVMNDLAFNHMIEKDASASYVDILLTYKTKRETMLYGNRKYQVDINHVEAKPNGLIGLEKRFGILDINQRIKRAHVGGEVFESDALIEAIEFKNIRAMNSLLNDPSIDDTLAYEYVKDKINYRLGDYWQEYQNALDSKRVTDGMRRMRHALDHDNESIIRNLLKIDQIARVIDGMKGGEFNDFIRNRIIGQGPQKKMGNILTAWKGRRKPGGKEYFEKYWGSDKEYFEKYWGSDNS